jgi:hypothetical protein
MGANVEEFSSQLRRVLLSMFELPWQQSQLYKQVPRSQRWKIWIGVWLYPVIGMYIGSTLGPLLTQQIGLTGSPLENYIWIGIALVVGALFQAFAVVAFSSVPKRVADASQDLARKCFPAGSLRLKLGSIAFAFVALLLEATPIVAVFILLVEALGAAAHNPKQVAGTVVIALLIKTFLIPLIKTAVLGAGVKAFFRWLRTGSIKGTDNTTPDSGQQ